LRADFQLRVGLVESLLAGSPGHQIISRQRGKFRFAFHVVQWLAFFYSEPQAPFGRAIRVMEPTLLSSCSSHWCVRKWQLRLRVWFFFGILFDLVPT
jgi:hypothetical protein